MNQNRVEPAPPVPRRRATAAAFLVLSLFGCGPSTSPNESNVAGPPVDPNTIPRDLDRDALILQQKKRAVAEFGKAPNGPVNSRRGR
jgi:hypothetical protein